MKKLMLVVVIFVFAFAANAQTTTPITKENKKGKVKTEQMQTNDFVANGVHLNGVACSGNCKGACKGKACSGNCKGDCKGKKCSGNCKGKACKHERKKE